MADAKKCDRCGRYYDKNETAHTGVRVIGIKIIRADDYCAAKYDFCDECLGKLKNFIDGEELTDIDSINFHYKIGDKVKLRAACECIITHMHRDAGYRECPFEDGCEFNDCKDENERELITTIDSIYNNGQGWYMSLKDLAIDIPLSDFGKTVFAIDTKDSESEAQEAAG